MAERADEQDARDARIMYLTWRARGQIGLMGAVPLALVVLGHYLDIKPLLTLSLILMPFALAGALGTAIYHVALWPPRPRPHAGGVDRSETLRVPDREEARHATDWKVR